MVFLIERGGDVNKRDVFGRTPLHVAAAVDFSEMIETLLEHGGRFRRCFVCVCVGVWGGGGWVGLKGF